MSDEVCYCTIVERNAERDLFCINHDTYDLIACLPSESCEIARRASDGEVYCLAHETERLSRCTTRRQMGPYEQRVAEGDDDLRVELEIAEIERSQNAAPFQKISDSLRGQKHDLRPGPRPRHGKAALGDPQAFELCPRCAGWGFVDRAPQDESAGSTTAKDDGDAQC